MAVTVTPLADRVLVKRLEAQQKTKGGIILPDSAQEKPKEGEIIATGEGKANDKGERTPLTVKAGDKVIFTSYAGTEIKIDDEEYLVMKEDDILAIINE